MRIKSHLRMFARLVVVAVGGVATTGCATPSLTSPEVLSRHEYSEVQMGVRARIVLYAATEVQAIDAARAAFARIAELDAIMSDYRVDSELMQLCDRAGQGPVPVSDDLYAVLSFAKELHDQSAGMFDVTAGPVIQLWRDMRHRDLLATPDVIDAARLLVGSQWMLLDPAARTVNLLKPGMRLDLGGIAKGYSSDAAAQVLRANGLDRFLVAMAGDIVVGEAPPGRCDWEVAVEGGVGALSNHGAPTLHLVNQAVSTSGDAQQFVEIGGVRYSHIVDPHTGLGSSRRIAATVVAPRGMMSDPLATTLCLLPLDEGLALIQNLDGVEAMIEEAAADGSVVRSTSGMAALLAPRKKSVP